MAFGSEKPHRRITNYSKTFWLRKKTKPEYAKKTNLVNLNSLNNVYANVISEIHKKFSERIEDYDNASSYRKESNQTKTFGIIFVPPIKDEVPKNNFVDPIHPAFRRLDENLTVIENAICETGYICSHILVICPEVFIPYLRNNIGHNPMLWKVDKERSLAEKNKVVFDNHKFYGVKIRYLSTSRIPSDTREFIWFVFRYISSIFNTFSNNIPFRYYFNFCYNSIDSAKFYNILRNTTFLKSIIFEDENGDSILTGKRYPAIISVIDILRIFRRKTLDSKFLEYGNYPKVLKAEIFDFSSWENIFKFHRQQKKFSKPRLMVKRTKKDYGNAKDNFEFYINEQLTAAKEWPVSVG